MKKSALHMLGVSSPMNQKEGELKNVSELSGYEPIQGSSGSFGFIGAGGIKLLGKLWKTFRGSKPAAKAVKITTDPVYKNPRIAAKAKGDMSYLSIAKADKSVSKLPKSSTKTPTQIFKETGVHTTKQFEHPSVSGYSKTTGKWVDL